MSFFSEKVLKRPPAEEVKGYSLREIEIARKNYNYGHNVCFYTVMVCFIVWAILCSVFRPDVAHASELVGGDEPIVTKYDNYVICSSSSGASSGKYLVQVRVNVLDLILLVIFLLWKLLPLHCRMVLLNRVIPEILYFLLPVMILLNIVRKILHGVVNLFKKPLT